MKYLLDTSTCISHLRGRSPTVTDRLASETGKVALCSVVVSELVFGACRSVDPQTELAKVERFIAGFTSLPLDDAAASSAGRIRAVLSAAGTPIGPYDLLIAAIAVANGLALVTSNAAEFARVAGLAVEDWRTG